MIISDLKHFQEVVAETNKIVGGQKLGQVVDGDTKAFLVDLGLGNLLGTQVTVNKASDGSNATKVAQGKTKEGDKIATASSDSKLVKS